MSELIRETRLIIDLKSIEHNIREIKKCVGNNVDVMPVIKARAYGTGIGTQIAIFEHTDTKIVGVAVVDEGVALRNRGFKKDIFILNQPFEEEIPYILQSDLISSACVVKYVKKLNEFAKLYNKIAKIHIEINTGMNRTGVEVQDLNSFLSEIKSLNNIKIDGVYTHFSSSDCDEQYTKWQIDNFNRALEIFKEFQIFSNLRYIHACNTAGILNFKEAHYNLVRPGISIYGHFPVTELSKKINLIPATKLKSKVVYIHKVKKGDSISYNRNYKASQDMIIATIPIGYADGIMRTYNGSVVINNSLAKIVGTINMDSFMVDITNISNVNIGSDVYIWDNDMVRLEDVANDCGTINYEILSRLAPRVKKEFILSE